MAVGGISIALLVAEVTLRPELTPETFPKIVHVPCFTWPTSVNQGQFAFLDADQFKLSLESLKYRKDKLWDV
jgi:hypothetical protein